MGTSQFASQVSYVYQIPAVCFLQGLTTYSRSLISATHVLVHGRFEHSMNDPWTIVTMWNTRRRGGREDDNGYIVLSGVLWKRRLRHVGSWEGVVWKRNGAGWYKYRLMRRRPRSFDDVGGQVRGSESREERAVIPVFPWVESKVNVVVTVENVVSLTWSQYTKESRKPEFWESGPTSCPDSAHHPRSVQRLHFSDLFHFMFVNNFLNCSRIQLWYISGYGGFFGLKNTRWGVCSDRVLCKNSSISCLLTPFSLVIESNYKLK